MTPEHSENTIENHRAFVNRPKQCPRRPGEEHQEVAKVQPKASLNPAKKAEGIVQEKRPGDTGVLTPKQAPRSAKPIEDKPAPVPDEGPTVDISKLIRRPEIWAPRILRIPIVYFGGLILFCLMGIWLLTSVIHLIGALALLPPWLAYSCASLLIVLAGIVIFLLGSVMMRYIRVPYRPQLELRQIMQARIARYGAYGQARVELSAYLEDIAAVRSEYAAVLKRFGLTDEKSDKFIKDLDELLRDRAIDGRAWLNEYQDNIQSVMDDLARRRQHHYATIVGLKTAISPWKAVDLMAVLYNNTLLVRDLCALANRRADGLRSLSILVHVGFNTFIASEAQGFARQTTSDAFEGYEQLADDLVSGGEPGVDAVADGAAEGARGLASDGIKAASKIAISKIGEGLANAWLTQRFGTRVWRLLTPLAE